MKSYRDMSPEEKAPIDLFYNTRKTLRKSLHAARCADRNQTPERMKSDGVWLDSEIRRRGIKLLFTTAW